MTEPQAPKRRRGCLFYGCLTGTICLLAVLLALLLGFLKLKGMLNQYTDTKPMALPTVQMPQPQIAEVRHRVETFTDAVRAGRPIAPLSLTADEINALIETSPDLAAMKNRLYVTITNGQLKGELSVPLEVLGRPLFKGRYLNGTGAFAVSLQSGLLRVSPQQLEAKGRPLPAVYMDRLRQENLAAGANNNPQFSSALNRLESIQVTDGKLTFVPKAP